MVKSYNDYFQKWIRKVRDIPILSKEQELLLIRKAQSGDLVSRNRIVERHILFVILLAHRYTSDSVPVEDMVSDGVMGMMEAITRFKPSMKRKFTTYAYYWIKLWILRNAIASGRLIRLPDWITERHKQFFSLLDVNPEIRGDKKYGANLGLSVLLNKVVSIQSHIGGKDGGESVYFLKDPGPEEIADDFRDLLGRLDRVEVDIIMSRFGLYKKRTYSWKEIAKRHKLSRQRVMQKEVNALSKLRVILRKDIKLLKGETWTEKNCQRQRQK